MCQIVKPDGTTVDFETTHTFSPDQVEWFKAGSALNIVRQKVSETSSDDAAGRFRGPNPPENRDE